MLHTHLNIINVRPMYFYDVYDLKFIAPELFLFSALLLMLIFGSLNFRNTKNIYNVQITGKILIFILLNTIVLLLNNLESELHGIILYDLLAIENLSTSAKIVTIILTISLLLSSNSYITKNALKEYDYVLILGLITGGLLVILSVFDFVVLFLAVELVSFGLYTLALIKRGSIYGTEAGTKYFIVGSFAAGIYIYGTSLIYLQTKTANFLTLHYYLYSQKIINNFELLNFAGYDHVFLIIGFSLILILLIFKIAAAPFHIWSPDVYEGVPLIVTAYYSIVVKFVMLITFIKTIFFTLYEIITIIKPGLILIAISSMLIGSIGACTQDKIKRLFAYSSISHIGYILIGVTTGTIDGLSASLLYTLIYVITNIVVFNFLLSSDYQEQEELTIYRVSSLSDLSGIGKAHPILGVMLAFALLSFAGIPPFAGFFAKLDIFVAAVNSGFTYLAVIAIISSSISCFYYLKIIKVLFFIPPEKEFQLINFDRQKEMTILWVTLFLSFFIFYHSNCYSTIFQLIDSYFFIFEKNG